MPEARFSNREIKLMLEQLNLKIEQLLEHAEKTGDKVITLEIQHRELREQFNRLEYEHREAIEMSEQRMKTWTLKALLVMTLLGSFVWIKESRDAIMSILQALF